MPRAMTRRSEESKTADLAARRQADRERQAAKRDSLALVEKWTGTHLKTGHALHLACATEAVRQHIRRYGEVPRCHGYLWRIDGAGDLCKLPLASRRPLPGHAPLGRVAHTLRLAGRKAVAE